MSNKSRVQEQDKSVGWGHKCEANTRHCHDHRLFYPFHSVCSHLLPSPYPLISTHTILPCLQACLLSPCLLLTLFTLSCVTLPHMHHPWPRPLTLDACGSPLSQLPHSHCPPCSLFTYITPLLLFSFIHCSHSYHLLDGLRLIVQSPVMPLYFLRTCP
jgi:hypothetical protein